MRKNINKLVAFAIGISVISGSVIPAFAADTVQNIDTITNVQTQAGARATLTLDDAIKAAISASETLQLDTKKITYQDDVNDINEDLDDYNNIDDDKKDFHKDTGDATSDKARQQRDFDEDILVQKVTKAYNNIVTSQMKIDKAAKALEIKNKQLNDTKLRQSLGLLTTTDLKDTQLQIESLQNQQKTSVNTLKDAQYSFKVLTGKDVTQYTLQQDIPYEALKIDGSIDNYLDDSIDKFLKYREEILKLKKDFYNDSDNKVTASDVSDAKTKSDDANTNKAPDLDAVISVGQTFDHYMSEYNAYEAEKNAYTNAVSARLTYLANKLSVDQEQTSVDEDRKNFKNQLRTVYTNLLSTQDSITTLKKNIELNNKKLSDAKLKYDLGMMVKSDYDTLVVNSKDLDLQLRSLIDTYNTLKEEIQKPWLISAAGQ